MPRALRPKYDASLTAHSVFEALFLRMAIRNIQKRGDRGNYLGRCEGLSYHGAIGYAVGGPFFSVRPTHIDHGKFGDELACALCDFPTGRARTQIYIGDQATNSLTIAFQNRESVGAIAG